MYFEDVEFGKFPGNNKLFMRLQSRKKSGDRQGCRTSIYRLFSINFGGFERRWLKIITLGMKIRISGFIQTI